MSGKLKLVSVAVTLAAALGGFGLLAGGQGTPAIAAPVLATSQPAIPAEQAIPAPTVQAESGKPAVDCAKQAWPYVARECLAAADGTPVRKVSRTIAVSTR